MEELAEIKTAANPHSSGNHTLQKNGGAQNEHAIKELTNNCAHLEITKKLVGTESQPYEAIELNARPVDDHEQVSEQAPSGAQTDCHKKSQQPVSALNDVLEKCVLDTPSGKGKEPKHLSIQLLTNNLNIRNKRGNKLLSFATEALSIILSKFYFVLLLYTCDYRLSH